MKPSGQCCAWLSHVQQGSGIRLFSHSCMREGQMAAAVLAPRTSTLPLCLVLCLQHTADKR